MYRLYIDESGHHGYQQVDEPAHRYLALFGAWFKLAESYTSFAANMNALKDRVFGPRPDNPVVLHRSDIINRKGPYRILNDPGKRKEFDEGILALVGQAQFTGVCVLIDKREHLRRYVDPDHPYSYCLTAMPERYCGWMNLEGQRGDVMAESRGKQEDRELRRAYSKVREQGTRFHQAALFRQTLTSNKIKARAKSANIAGLQLADLLAFPVKQACLVRRGIIPEPGGVFGTRLAALAHGKLNRKRSNEQVDGYGIVSLSMPHKPPPWLGKKR